MRNIPGTVRAIDRGDGICELRKDPDVLCIIQQRPKRSTKALAVLGTVGIFLGAALAIIYMAPAFGTILFALLAGLVFASIVTKEEEE